MNSALNRALWRLRRWFLSMAIVAGMGIGLFPAQSARATDLGIDSIQPQKVPCGKTLVVPVSANGDGPLNFTVKSSDPNIIPLVRTGSPFLKMSVSYPGTSGSNASQAFSGDLVFQLFRDLAPKTVGFIGGFAQAGYYDNVLTPFVTGTDPQVSGTYNSSIFHRITNLTGTSAPVYIAQGGDPDANNPSTTGTLTHGPGFSFDNECNLPLIFSGKGQLAMANGGISSYRGTNGSQFFISQGPLRHLDFKHTIFGQLVRDDQAILDKLMAVPVDGNSKPNADVVIESVSLVKDDTDAVLFLSAAGKVSGTATVTVTAVDAGGNSTTQAFPVTTYADTVDDPPILGPLANPVVPFGKSANVSVSTLDLESDYVNVSAAISSGTGKATSKVNGNIVTVSSISKGWIGRAGVGIGAVELGGYSATDSKLVNVGLGVRSLVPVSSTLSAKPGEAIANGVVATFRAAQVSGTLGNFSAKINWGDGTPLSSGSDVTVTPTVSPANGFAVSGSHTYAQAGQYSILVSASDSIGATIDITTPAIVTAEPLVALGRDLSMSGGSISGREIAAFTDGATTGNPADYTVQIDWGDGARNAGTIRKSLRGFSVIGSHKYKTNTTYSIRAEVTKPSSNSTAVAWGTARVRGVNSTHLPPFAIPHIVGQLYSVTKNSSTSLSTGVLLLNNGKKTSGPVTLKFVLWDQYFGSDDVPLQVASFVRPVPSLKPNEAVSFWVTNIQIPSGVSTKYKFLKMKVSYSDPLADEMAFGREFSSPSYLQ